MGNIGPKHNETILKTEECCSVDIHNKDTVYRYINFKFQYTQQIIIIYFQYIKMYLNYNDSIIIIYTQIDVHVLEVSKGT